MAVRTVLKTENRERFFYLDLLAMLVLPAVMAWYYYGGKTLRLMFICMVSSVVFETVGAFLMKCPRDLNDGSALFIGAAIPLMLPANTSVWTALCGVAFAVIAVKLPLGGTFSVPFVPTAAGFSFLCLCWPDKVFSYPALEAGSEYIPRTSLAGMLSLNTSIRPNVINIFDILTGNVPGPVGATCIIVLVGCAVYLGFRHRRALINTAGFLAVCAVMALAFPRIYAESRLTSLAMELFSGLLIFSSIFLITDPATSPERPSYRFIYGAFTGALCMLLRYFGKFEEGVCFAILLSNAVWPNLERRLDKLSAKRDAKKRVKNRVKASKISSGKEAVRGE